MGEFTGIEWTHWPGFIGGTWNPWRGCHKLSPACAHCYMFREQYFYGKDPNVVVRCSDSTFNAPLKYKEPHCLFTCSWSDFFIEEADAWRIRAWEIIQSTPHHQYLILTKRPERVMGDMPSNVALGVSVENQRFYSRIDRLRETKASLHFLSIEPLLGRMSDLPLEHIEWVIVGGESGPGFRPLNLDWVREIREQCQAKGVPFFFKQYSGFQPKKLGRELDGRTWDELPILGQMP
jgi:protein gp37